MNEKVEQLEQELGKHWKETAMVVVAGVLITAILMVPTGEKKHEQDNIIEGGVIGGPVQVGKTRIKVVGGEGGDMKVSERTVDIVNFTAQPETLQVVKNTDVRIKNSMDSDVQLNFIGYRKMANLAPGRIYSIKFNERGLYNYTIRGGGFSSKGHIDVG